MNNKVELYKTIKKDDKPVYIIRKAGVYFAMDIENVREVHSITGQILANPPEVDNGLSDS